MSEKERKSLNDIAGEVAALVRDFPGSRSILRKRIQTWYGKYKKSEQKWYRYLLQLRELKKNIVFSDPEYQVLCGNKEGLSLLLDNFKEKQPEPEAVKKASPKDEMEPIELTEDAKKIVQEWILYFRKNLHKKLEVALKMFRKREIYLEKKYEQAKAKLKKPTGRDPRGSLSLPEFYPTYESAHYADLFSRVDERPYFDKDLGPLARYVILTIIHDKELSGSRTKAISAGIWPRDESFAEGFWEELQAGWEHSEEIRGIINEDIQNVKYELNNQAGSPNNKAAGRVIVKLEQAQAQAVSPVKNNTKKKKANPKTKTIKDRFRFGHGQVFFDKKDLGLPVGEVFEISKKLVENIESVVAYKTFDKNYSSAIPGTLPKSVTIIRRHLEKRNVPCVIQSKRDEGYVMKEDQGHKCRKKRVKKKS